MSDTEAQIQSALIMWFDAQCLMREPSLMINITKGQGKKKVGRKVGPLFAIPNGAQTADGGRQGAILRAQGARSGVADLFLAVIRNCYGGMFIEVKAAKGRESHNQGSWRVAMVMEGYSSIVCTGIEPAQTVIAEYMGWEL